MVLLDVADPWVRWGWIASHRAVIQDAALQHIQLTAIAVLGGLLIATPVGLAAWRWRRLRNPVLGVSGILYTIPSLALFAMLVPFTGLSVVTAEIGLIGYTLLILVRNIVSGLRSVPPDVREAAVGMGYSQWQLLWRIELPLALAVIIAGVRVSSIRHSSCHCE